MLLPRSNYWQLENGRYVIPKRTSSPKWDSPRSLTIVPKLQKGLEDFIATKGNHTSAVIVVEISTGKVLALAEGKPLDEDGFGEIHTGLYPNFPAASVFKMVSAAAAFQSFPQKDDWDLLVRSGCDHVDRYGHWLRDDVSSKRQRAFTVSMGRAFAKSCNGYFARLGVEVVGLNAINLYADQFGFGRKINADFFVPKSPIVMPQLESSSVSEVGRYAAGFGNVGLSVAHAGWMLANMTNPGGKAVALQIFENHDDKNGSKDNGAAGKSSQNDSMPPMLNALAMKKLQDVMAETVKRGSGQYAFRRYPYRQIRHKVGGKTGTLEGFNPKGLTTWFAGVMPIDNPQIAVAAVVLTPGAWVIKGGHLAAHAFWLSQQEILAH